MEFQNLPTWVARPILIGILLLASGLCLQCKPTGPTTPPGTVQLASWGGDLHNTHHAQNEVLINPSNVHTLTPAWVATTKGNVSAIPTLSDTIVYFSDWGAPLLGGSNLYGLDRLTGKVAFKKSVLNYSANLLNTLSRSSPAIWENIMVFGDLRNQPSSIAAIPGAHGAKLYAVDRTTGKLLWKTTLDTHPLAVVTQSPVIHNGKVYVGVSSFEEVAAKLGYPCCTFRGSMLALDLFSGQIVWQQYTIPPIVSTTQGDHFSGAAVWGSAPTIDIQRNAVYIATGNNYTFPKILQDCIAQLPGDPQAQQTQCYDVYDHPENFAESVLAFDLDTGAKLWTRKMKNFGAWTFACDPSIVPWLAVNPANCQDLDSLDYDFGQTPMLVTAQASGLPSDLLGIGQKSGVFWALDPDNFGATVWETTVGPGGALGGMEFGSATDGQRFYVQITNFAHEPFALTAGPQTGLTVNGGIWAALDVATGQILWQTPDPASFDPLTGGITHLSWGANLGPGFFGVAMGPLTIANGVLFGGSMDRAGHMYAFDAATGEILWQFASGGSVMSAPAIYAGMVYWGSGYQTGFNNNKFYAFKLAGP